jgi:glycosyltransferase involved in cell wall biosynthesis
LFVNDGSNDGTLKIMHELYERDAHIAYLDLSRNYGKETAMAAGIDHISGDALCIIDADLQDPPELIEDMIKGIEDGYDDVYAQRISREGESFLKKMSSKLYYRMLASISDIPIQKDTGDYRMFSRKAIDALRQMKERQRNMKGLFSYIGFRKHPIMFKRDKRIAGKTKWNYFKLVNLAVKGLTSFSTFPLRMISVFGVAVAFLAFCYLVFIVVRSLLWGNSVAGYPSMMAVILFLGGAQLLALGIIGEYLGIVYSETKNRPTYFVNEYRTREASDSEAGLTNDLQDSLTGANRKNAGESHA